MPSRRSLLASASTLAAGSLAGCSTRDDRFSPATFVHFPQPPESVSRVGRAEMELGDDCPHGLGRVTVRLFERSSRLHLRTEFSLITGESNCTSGWGNEALEVRHGWTLTTGPSEGIAGTGSDVVPVDRSDAPFALAGDQRRTHRDWHVRFTPPRTSTTSLTFASTFATEVSPTPGEQLGRVSATWSVSKGLLGAEQFRLQVPVRYEPE